MWNKNSELNLSKISELFFYEKEKGEVLNVFATIIAIKISAVTDSNVADLK